MELLYIAGGIAIGSGLMWYHRWRIEKKAASVLAEGERRLQAEQALTRQEHSRARYYEDKVNARRLDEATAEGFLEGYQCGQADRYQYNGLQQVAESLQNGAAATVFIKRRRTHHAGSN